MSSSVRIALTGFGYWGTKLARNIADTPGCDLVAVCDGAPSRREAAATQYGVSVFATFDDLLAAPGIDAIVLATPAADHHAQARAALCFGRHVMVEKPLALRTSECDELLDLATARGLVHMTGHTFLYSAPVRMLRELITGGELGSVLYCYSQRLSLGAIREDASAMWDLAPHDISIFLYLLGSTPTMVSSQQFSLIGERREDIAMLTLTFPGGAVGHAHVSRLDPRKVRELTIVGDRKMVVYDDTNPEMPIRIYDRGVDRAALTVAGDLDEDFGHHNLQLRTGDMLAPNVVGREPLRVEIEDFVTSVAEGRRPVSDGALGRDVVAVLEAAERSSILGGQPAVPGALTDQEDHGDRLAA
jgi:predicted dehydrogenase